MSSPKARRLLFVCNAIDDTTRAERRITTDSPAASRKVFMMLDALRGAGVNAHALSLGRGRRDNSAVCFPGVVRRAGRHATIYLPFSNRRLWSELLSLIAPVGVLWRLRGKARQTTILFYNRERAWLLALLAARLLGYRTALDLEDGLSGLAGGVGRRVFDGLCTGGVLLACSGLAKSTRLRPTLCYYGVSDSVAPRRDWQGERLRMLIGGTLTEDTGTVLLADAVKLMRATAAPWAAGIELHVTGKGDGLAGLQNLAGAEAGPSVTIHGRTTDAEYRAIIDGMHVGLALKLNDGCLADTTFPSKVIEMADAGLLVLSTDISDVRAVLGDGAVYLERDDAALLVARMQAIVADRSAAAATAERGRDRVGALCAPAAAGSRLAAHLFPAGR